MRIDAPTITEIANLTSDGIVVTSGENGTLGVIANALTTVLTVNVSGYAASVLDASDSGTYQFTGAGAGNNYVATFPAANFTAARTDTGQIFTGSHTFSSDLTVNGLTVGKGNNSIATNAAFGINALSSVVTANLSTALGNNCLKNSTVGGHNTGTGNGAGINITFGSYDCIFGYVAMEFCYTGSNNAAFGYAALYSCSTGIGDSAFGSSCLQDISPTAMAISAFANYSGTVAGTIKATSNGHGRTTGDSVIISGTVNYNGTYTITVIDVNNFYFTQTYVDNPTTGWWTLSTQLGSYNSGFGSNTGRGITYGSYNTILGANVTGLSAGLSYNIILATGDGTIRGQFDGTNWTFSGKLTATTLQGAHNSSDGTAGETATITTGYGIGANQLTVKNGLITANTLSSAFAADIISLAIAGGSITNGNPGGPYTTGVMFMPTINCDCTGIQFYGFSGETYTVSLYIVGNSTAIASASSSQLGANGVVSVSFASVALSAYTRYIATIWDQDNKHYVYVPTTVGNCPACPTTSGSSYANGGIWCLNPQIFLLAADMINSTSHGLPTTYAGNSSWYPIEPIIVT